MSELTRHRANHLLATARPCDFGALAPDLEIVDLTPRSVLAEPGSVLDYAYFPHTGVISLMAVMRRGIVETATIGPEGFIGFEGLLGGATARQRMLVQVAGTASRLPMHSLRAAAGRSPEFNRLLFGYVRYFIVQALQSVACSALHTVQERCARWLLAAHDGAGADSFHLTQEFLAEILGIHRPSVTIVARALQKAGVIRYSRGTITVTDRNGLEHAACECYALVRKTLVESLFPAVGAE
jgi:CRP-like cAMP-binding protein